MSDPSQPNFGGAGARFSLANLATSLPGVVAVSLAALYTLGALLTMADLGGAGLRIADVLPLIPVTDLLARGVGSAVAGVLVLAGLVAFAACYRGYDPSSASRSATLWWIAAIVLMFGSLLLGFYAFPIIITLGLVAGVVALFICEVVLSLDAGAIAVAYVVVVASFALNAIVAPRPLPVATVYLASGGSTSGRLITSADGRWTLVGLHDEITVIPDTQVKSVGVTKGKSSRLHRNLQRFIGIPWWPPAVVIAVLVVTICLWHWSNELASWLRRGRRKE